MSASPAPAPLRPRALLAVAAYAALVVLLVAIAAGSVADILQRRDAVASASDLLQRLQDSRAAARGAHGGGAAAGPAFLEGSTLTIAGAGLMQHLSELAARHDGQITSSRVELEGTRFGPDFLAVSASLDIDQQNLQGLLYDIEAGRPFLFAGQLAIQRAEREPREDAEKDPRLRVTLMVYGRWEGRR